LIDAQMPFKRRYTDQDVPDSEIKYDLATFTGIAAYDTALDSLFNELNHAGFECSRTGAFSEGCYNHYGFVNGLDTEDFQLFMYYLNGPVYYYSTS